MKTLISWWIRLNARFALVLMGMGGRLHKWAVRRRYKSKWSFYGGTGDAITAEVWNRELD